MPDHKNELYLANIFKNLQISIKTLINDEFFSYKYLVEAVKEGIVDPDLSIVDNMNAFILKAKANDRIKANKAFSDGLDEFHQLLESSNSDLEKLAKLYNPKIIDLILEKRLVPYAQVDIARMYFMNPNKSMEAKSAFLDEKIEAIFNGGSDFRMINSLDKIAIDPEFLNNSYMYQELMDRLLNEYLKDYDKYKKKNKTEDQNARYIIRMIYRHQNKGYYVPMFEGRDAIISTYAYNGWFKELKFMISNNTLGITKDNYLEIIEVMKKALIDMATVCEFNEDKYLEMQEKFNELYVMVTQIALEGPKLVRKED